MLSDETLDLYDSSSEDDVKSQESLTSFSELNTNNDREIPEHNRNQNMDINKRLANSHTSSDDEESIVLDSSPQSCVTNASQHVTTPSREEQNFYCSGKSFTLDSIDELSFIGRERKSNFPVAKVAEFKALLDKVNEANVNSRINQFVLDTIKNKCTSWSQQTKQVTKTFDIQSKIKLQSVNGEVINLLGLDDEYIELISKRPPAVINRSAFRDHALEVVKANVAKLKLQKKSLQDEFGAHSRKVMEGLMTRERLEQLELQRRVEDQIHKARQLLSSNHEIAQQLATLRNNSERQLQAATFAVLQNKALLLQTHISKIKEEMDRKLVVDEDTRKKIDSEGDDLKLQVSEMKEKLKVLQKTLLQYEKKEASSDIYKKIVDEYGKLKKQLDYKSEALKVVSDSNMSF